MIYILCSDIFLPYSPKIDQNKMNWDFFIFQELRKDSSFFWQTVLRRVISFKTHFSSTFQLTRFKSSWLRQGQNEEPDGKLRLCAAVAAVPPTGHVRSSRETDGGSSCCGQHAQSLGGPGAAFLLLIGTHPSFASVQMILSLPPQLQGWVYDLSAQTATSGERLTLTLAQRKGEARVRSVS